MVDALARAALRYTPAARQEKLGLLERLEATAIGRPGALRRYHEVLCYLQAYPDDGETLARVDGALARWEQRIHQLSRAAHARLRDSGIAGTTLSYPFGLAMSRWLVTRDPLHVRILWGGEAETERLEETLSVLVTPAEGEAFTEGGPGGRRWLDAVADERGLSSLQVLVELFQQSRLDEPTRAWLFEGLGLILEWQVPVTGPSRTHARLPRSPCSFHGDAGDRRRIIHGAAGVRGKAIHDTGGAGRRITLGDPRTRRDFVQLVRQPVKVRDAAPALAADLIDAARLAMATRARELYAFSYPNPGDVLFSDLDQGLRVALIGLPRDLRLPLDAYYAFLVLKSGVPVSYGAGWYVFGALEVGFNVFESFRHGESAFIASQVFSVYRQVFDVRAIVVDRYQIGYGNDEALRSGAFYFYQRLGFHPLEASARGLARAEQAKIARDPGYRSPLGVLRRLARGDLVLRLGAPGPPRVRASALAMRVSEHISRRFAGDRIAATRAATARVASALDADPSRTWRGAERRSWETFALLLELVPDLEAWTVGERRALREIIRAKAGASERAYARLMDRHRRLHDALHTVTRSADP